VTQLATQRWLDFIRTRRAEDLSDLLADHAVFYSPAVFSPQRGRAKAAAYLLAAEKMFTTAHFHHRANDLPQQRQQHGLTGAFSR
jgi:hypothetical protein